MSSIRGENTGPEKTLFALLRGDGLRFSRHAKTLPGRPDVVFTQDRVAVFVDGDFWHGWRYPAWKSRLSPHWQGRIETNRARDARNHRRLRRMGWVVVRVWEHQLARDPAGCLTRVKRALAIAGQRVS